MGRCDFIVTRLYERIKRVKRYGQDLLIAMAVMRQHKDVLITHQNTPIKPHLQLSAFLLISLISSSCFFHESLALAKHPEPAPHTSVPIDPLDLLPYRPPPQVQITDPEDAFITNQTPIIVTGTYAYASAVEVNGIQATLSRGIFTVSHVPLTEGENEITAIAHQNARQAQDTVHGILDTIPPNIKFIAPKADFLTNDPNITVTGAHDDATQAFVNAVQAEIYDGEGLVDQKNPIENHINEELLHSGEEIGEWDHAESFLPSVAGELAKITIPLAKIGDPTGQLTVEIQTDGLEVVRDQLYDTTHQDESFGLNNFSSQTKLAQGFTSSLDADLDRVSLSLKTVRNPNGNLTVAIHDGVVQSQNFQDASNAHHRVTANGDVQVDETTYQLGNASGAFDGDGDYLSVPDHADWQLSGSGGSVYFDGDGDYLTVPDHDDWRLGGGNGVFTIDTWVRFTDVTPSQALVGHQGDQGNRWDFRWNGANAGAFRFRLTEGNEIIINVNAPFSPSAYTWYHVALVRGWGGDRDAYAITIDGTQFGDTVTNASVIPNFDAPLFIGIRTTENNNPLYGNLDEIRISDTARWTENFTPPVSEYSADQNTHLLLHLNQDFTDFSNRHTVEPRGDVVIDNDQFRFSSDFTIDTWVRFNTVNQYQSIMAQDESNERYWIFYWRRPSSELTFQVTNGPGVDVIMAKHIWNPDPDTWYHVAVVKHQSEFILFVNGQTLGVPHMNHSSVPDYNGLFFIGNSEQIAAEFHGHMDEIRISDIARWTTDFQVPTDEYTADEDTKLLMHMNSEIGISEDPIQNGLSSPMPEDVLPGDFSDAGDTHHRVTANGDAQVDNAEYQFGNAAALFDGDGDYLSVPDHPDWQLSGPGGSVFLDGDDDYLSIPANPDFRLGDNGTGPSTLETWVRFKDTNSNQQFFEFFTDSANRWYFQWDNNNQELVFTVFNGGTDDLRIRRPWMPTADAWYHIALIRGWGDNPDDWAFTIDGVKQGATVTADVTIGDYTNSLYIGKNNGNHNHIDGHLDEIRISNIARWTENFTPPTQEYQNDGNTKLLLHLNVNFDDASNRHTLEPRGGVGIDNNQFMFSGDFTIDTWVMFDNLEEIAAIASQTIDGTHLWWFSYRQDTEELRFAAFNETLVLYQHEHWLAETDVWYHVALVKSGSEYKMYVNGSQIGETSIDHDALPRLAANLDVGTYLETSKYLNGRLDEVRISDTARWTSDFQVPTNEYTTDENTKLLLHMNDTFDTIQFSFPDRPTLLSNKEYFLVLSTSRGLNSNDYVRWGNDAYDATYAGGFLFVGNDGQPTDWMRFENEDFIFQTTMYVNRLGVPSTVAIPDGISSQILESSLSEELSDIDFTFDPMPVLTEGVPYHIVLKTDRDEDPANHVAWARGEDDYADGASSENFKDNPLDWRYPQDPSDLIFQTTMRPEGIHFTDQVYEALNQNASSAIHQSQDAGAWDQAQGIRALLDSRLTEVTLYLMKVENPAGTLTVEIREDDNGVPSSTVVENGISEAVDEPGIPTELNDIAFSFPQTPLLESERLYHLVLTTTRDQDGINYILWGSDNVDPEYQGGARSYNSRAEPDQWIQESQNDFIFRSAVVYDGPWFVAEDVPLVEGVNVLTATASDRAQNASTISRVGMLDTIPPAIEVTSPVEDFITNNPLIMVVGTYDDAETITVNDIQAELDNGMFTAVDIPLTEGENTLTIVAIDLAENETLLERHGILDTIVPEIIITAPAGRNVGRRDLTIEGQAVDASHIASVKINGEVINFNPITGVFDHGVALVEGPNAFLIVAIDLAGNSNEQNPYELILNYLYGDVNEDGERNVLDGQNLVNQLIGAEPFFPSSDMNHDGELTQEDHDLWVDVYLTR